jgi:two-component system response regulator PilR (NtrC family)
MTAPPRTPARILVVDDEEVMLDACRVVLERSRYQVELARSPFQGRDRALRDDYAVVLLDLRMPGLDGLQILSALREYRPATEVVVMSGFSTIETAVHSIKLGAFDYLPKPFTPDELLRRVDAAVDHGRRRRADAAGDPAMGSLMVGSSDAMQRVRALVARVGAMDATVLVIGESGTGKELVAQAVHGSSPRRDKPFVSLDCSALTPGLLESELFGHVKGAFTGAVVAKPGLFEVAHHGTLFLDEVSNLSLETQGKLLRVLESSEIRPVGGVDTKKVDIRLVAATNRDLADAVTLGQFREDLFYRLNVVPIELPPLRERSVDVPQLLEHFLSRYRRPSVGCPSGVSPEALERLVRYPWPGNVRELRNLVERLVVTVDEDTIRAGHLPDHLTARPGNDLPPVPLTNQDLKTLKRAMRERSDSQVERIFVVEALRRSSWNVTRAAQATGLLRPNFHALMRKHGIRVDDLKD